MARREELLRAEAEGWDAFVALADAVPAALVERPGLNAEGWAARDVMWHVAFWCAEAGRVLSAIAQGRFDPVRETNGDAEVNRLNDRELERSRGMGVDEIRAELHRARAAMLERFGALAVLTVDADEWFEESGPAHYAQHAAELASWVRTNRR
jgi:hypothetical protein